MHKEMELKCRKTNRLKITIVGLAIIGAVTLSLFNHWEIMAESWGYWLFARIFAESGRFIIPDRSPLYILYLNLFRWLGYPASVTLEYMVTSCIVVISLVVLFRKYLGLGLAFFASLLWIPFLQVSEPPVQKLALACSCLAIVSRRGDYKRFRFIVSYALLGLAYMFRNTYIILIVLFAAYDIFRTLKQKGSKVLLSMVRPRISDWPFFFTVGLLVYFLTMQSPHPWNNAWLATNKWFPSKGRTLSECSFIGHYNWEFIRSKYGTFEDKDFYFTNQELFGGATTIVGAIRANPRFIANQLIKNIKSFIPVAINITQLHKIYFNLSGIFKFSVGWLCLISIFFIIFGALHAIGDSSMLLFMIGNILIICSTSIALPKERYMVPFIPVLILSSYRYGVLLCNALTIKCLKQKKENRFFYYSIILIVLLFFSSGTTDWWVLINRSAKDLRQGKVRIMETGPYSMKASFVRIEPLVRGCKGIMLLENKFIGAFMNIKLTGLYDIWEIPPFGHLGDSVYGGLSTDRVDCVLVSNSLATEVGFGTNMQIRYKNYIEPYIEQMKAVGATSYEIKGFGLAVILQRPDDKTRFH